MRSLLAIHRNHLRTVASAWHHADWAQRAVAAGFLALGAALFIGASLFFLRGFEFILREPFAGPLLARYMLETAFAFAFFLGAASFVVSSVSLLFKADEVKLLAAMPVDPLSIFLARFDLAALMSAWPVMLIAVPAIVALGVVLGAPAPYYVFAGMMVLLFALAVSVAGGLVSFALAPLARRLPTVWLRSFGAAALVFGAMALVRSVVSREVFTMFDVSDPVSAEAVARRIAGMFSWSPSHPFADVVASVLPFGAPPGPALTLAMTAVALAAAAGLLFLLASRHYLPLWQRFGETGFIARPADAAGGPAHRRPFPSLFRLGHGFLFEKDLLTMARDDDEVSRAGFLCLLLLVYLFTVRAVSRIEAFDRSQTHALMLAFAFAATCYFALTFALRFIFPSISLEGRAAWVLWSSPLHAHEIFSWKFFFWSAALAAVTEAATVVIVLLFGLPLLLALGLFFAAGAVAVSLSAMALAIGALWPSLDVRDPDLIATSPAGLFAAAAGFVYLWIVVRYVHGFVEDYLVAGSLDIVALAGILIVSSAVVAASWSAAMRPGDRLHERGSH